MMRVQITGSSNTLATKGEIFSKMGVIEPEWKPMRKVTHGCKYTHAREVFGRLLGDPLGSEEFETEAAEAICQKLRSHPSTSGAYRKRNSNMGCSGNVCAPRQGI